MRVLHAKFANIRVFEAKNTDTMRYRKITVLFIVALIYSGIQAQSSLQLPWYVNINGGISQLYGDLQNYNNPVKKLNGETGIGFGARLGRSLNSDFYVHLQLSSLGLQGAKESIGQEFTSRINEIQFGGTASLTNLILGEKERLFNVYALTGIGVIAVNGEMWRTEGDPSKENNVGKENALKTSGEFGLAIPLAIGLDIKLNDRMFLNLEPGLRLANNDLLDGYERGGHMDAYFYSSVGISYIFSIPKKKKKKVVVPPEIAGNTSNKFANTKVRLDYDIPDDLKSMDEFILKCTIHKGTIDGSAELTQVLPIGFNITDTLIDNARMEFKNYTLSLYWDELPKDSVFNISYNVKLDKIYGQLPMTSILYLDRTNKEYRFKTDVFIKRKITAEPIVVKEEKPKEEEMVSPSEKVEFRIQLRASYNRQLSTDSLKEYLGLDKNILEEKLGRWYKYSVGRFKTYQEAREFRNELTKQRKLKDAFIIAYYDGNRLNTLSELQELAPESLPGGAPHTKYKETGNCYRVQVLALQESHVAPSVIKDMYDLDQEVNEEVYHTWRKYTVGECLTKEEALTLRLQLIEKGLTGAFLVKYSEGERAGL